MDKDGTRSWLWEPGLLALEAEAYRRKERKVVLNALEKCGAILPSPRLRGDWFSPNPFLVLFAIGEWKLRAQKARRSA